MYWASAPKATQSPHAPGVVHALAYLCGSCSSLALLLASVLLLVNPGLACLSSLGSHSLLSRSCSLLTLLFALARLRLSLTLLLALLLTLVVAYPCCYSRFSSAPARLSTPPLLPWPIDDSYNLQVPLNAFTSFAPSSLETIRTISCYILSR